MIKPIIPNAEVETTISAELPRRRGWADWFNFFLRGMAILSMVKGLYHWILVCGIAGVGGVGFEGQSIPWQTATVFFAVFDLVAAVGLWLCAPWGAVIWLASSVSMIVIDLVFPQIYGASIEVILAEVMLIAVYLYLAIMAARERPA
jgi:hypothetical protein